MAQATPAAPAKREDSISELARSEARTAFWLLAPTFTILLLLAIYPLGQVFYLSFTNARFADPGSTTEFVGWQNYRDLLSFTIRELPPELGDDGQQVVEDGVPQFERASRVLRGEGDARDFRAVREFNLGGNRYVLGAAKYLSHSWTGISLVDRIMIYSQGHQNLIESGALPGSMLHVMAHPDIGS